MEHAACVTTNCSSAGPGARPAPTSGSRSSHRTPSRPSRASPPRRPPTWTGGHRGTRRRSTAARGRGTDPAERIEAVRRLAKTYEQRRTEMAELITTEIGAPISFAQRAQVALPWSMIERVLPISPRRTRGGRTGRACYGSDIHIRREPVGVVAAIVPWNMPQFLIVTKLIPALLAGCTRRASNPRRSRRSTPCCSPRSSPKSGLPPGVVEHPARRRDRGRAPGAPSRGGQGVVHRVDAGGPGRRRRLRRGPAAGQPRTGRQVRGDRARRRRPRRGRGGRALGQPVQQRTDLQRTHPGPGARRARRRVHRRTRRRDERTGGRRSLRQCDAGGSARGAAPAGTGARIHRGRIAGGRPPRGRRRRDARRPGPRLVRPADAVRRRRQLHADRPRGDLRPGADGAALLRRRAGRGDRQRLRLRPGRLGVDRRPRCRPRRRRAHPHRHLRRQPGLPDGSVRPVRRREGQWLRPRTRPRGDRRLHRHQVHRSGSRPNKGA